MCRLIAWLAYQDVRSLMWILVLGSRESRSASRPHSRNRESISLTGPSVTDMAAPPHSSLNETNGSLAALLEAAFRLQRRDQA